MTTKKLVQPIGVKVGDVYYTEDLSRFKNLEFNRDIEPRVKNIVHSMVHDGLKYCPIIVNTDFEVIDGKHRLHAASLAGRGIYYIIDESCKSTKQSEDTMIIVNMNTKSWTKFMFLNHYADKGVKSYVTLRNFKKQYPDFSLSDCLMFLNNNSNYPSQYDKDFEHGKWRHNSVDVGISWAEFMMGIKDFYTDGFNRSIFVRTMITILSKYPDFSKEHFLHKCSMCTHKLTIQGDRNSYIRMIEEIYNYKTKEDNRIFLRL